MTRRVIGVVVALLMFAACGSGSKKSASPTTSTVTHQVRVSTEPPSSVPSSTSTPDTIASGGCTGQIGFAEAAGEWVASHLHITETLTVA
ncbi:MAG: hypothetical protein JWL83_2074, partial [Actinomycetia bacterium]|nr:hypothetical protein [Actinomycetes bacterium]